MTSRHVLLLEQHLALHQLVALALDPLDLTLHCCASVEAARRWMDVHGVPDLLLTCLKMPRETGLDFIAALRSGAHWQQALPVIVLTASDTQNYMAELTKHRVLKILVKPVSLGVLLEAVSLALEVPAHNSQREAVRTCFGGDVALHKVFLDGCIRQLPVDAIEISAACERFDWETVKRVVHSLKGVLALLREDAACELARRVEQAASVEKEAEVIAVWSVLRNWLSWFCSIPPGSSLLSQAPSLYIPEH
jgi:DNA-binding response OmpR family regulator